MTREEKKKEVNCGEGPSIFKRKKIERKLMYLGNK
jgi:hypothetical protein